MKLTKQDLIKIDTDAQRRVSTGTKATTRSTSPLQIPATRRGHRRRGGSAAINPFDGNKYTPEDLQVFAAISRAGRPAPLRTRTSIDPKEKGA